MDLGELEFHIKNKHYVSGFNESSKQNYKDYFNAMVKMFALDEQKPRIVDNKTFKNYSGKIIYRGYDSNFLKFIQLKKEFLCGNYQRYHKNSNNFGAGLYFLDNTKVIKEDFYGDNIIKKLFNTTILSAKIDETNIINAYELDKLFESKKESVASYLIEKCKSCSKEELNEFISFLSKSNQYIFKALFLGFDGIWYKMYGSDKFGNKEISRAYVVYNRKCLTVGKSFYKKNYKQQTPSGNETNKEKVF